MMTFTRNLKVLRTRQGSFVRGRYTDNGEKTEFFTRASVQPHFFRETEKLPEGREIVDAIKIYSDKKLIPMDDEFGTDVVEYNGYLYEVYQVRDYVFGLLPHYKSIALKFNDEQQSERNGTSY